MITTEIYIEKKRLDITEDISTLLTFCLDDVKDFASRNTAFSKTIVLPGTSNNNTLFGHIFDARVSNPYIAESDNVATNFNASVGADCLIFQDHIQIFKGTLRLLEIVIDKGVPEYECAVFGELGGLVSALGNLKLEDLDFSAYNHAWTAAEITASWDADSAGFYYPLIDYGLVSTNKIDYDIRALRPALFVREYIDKMLTDAGFTFQSALFDTDRFKHLIIPHNLKSLQKRTAQVVSGTDTTTQVIIQNGVDFEAPIPTAVRSATGFTYAAGVWTYNGVDTKTFKVTLSVSGDYHCTQGHIEIDIQVNGNAVETLIPLLPVVGTTDTLYAYTPQDFYITLATGDTINPSARVPVDVGTYRLRTTTVDFGIFNDPPVFADYSPGDTIIMNDTIPRNILQKDFFKSILTLFNLYVYDDKFIAKKLLIAPYVDFYDLNASGVVDWTYKCDRAKVQRLRPMSELNARYYEFKFKQDADYYNEFYRTKYNQNYGDYLYDSGFEFVNEKSEVELIFSPSVLVGYAGVDKIVSALYKKTGVTEEPTGTNIRIMQAKKIFSVAPWDIEDAGVDVFGGSNLTEYGYGGHYDDPDAPGNDIHFGVPAELFFTLLSGAINVTQFNVYWSSYMAEITDKDSKLLIAYFKLTHKDIFDLDFSKLIFFDGSYWRLNKVEDWNANTPEVCRCEILRVIHTTY